MASFLLFVLGFLIATALWLVVIVFIAAGICAGILPFFMMRHSTEESMDVYRREHPWKFRWWKFVAWLDKKFEAK